MHSKTMYAMATEDDLTGDGRGRIRILAEFNEPDTEIDMVTYSVDDNYDRTGLNVIDSLFASGYRIVGSITEAANGLFMPVEKINTSN